jgi:hypothetical protein
MPVRNSPLILPYSASQESLVHTKEANKLAREFELKVKFKVTCKEEEECES